MCCQDTVVFRRGIQREDMEVRGIKLQLESVLYPEEYLRWFVERSSTENTQIKSDFEIFGSALQPRDETDWRH